VTDSSAGHVSRLSFSTTRSADSVYVCGDLDTGQVKNNSPTAIIYVDGLNLYKQLLQFHPRYKWLDLTTLSKKLLPNHEILMIRYFTARIKPPFTDPDAANRQDTYLYALQSLKPRIAINFGRMSSKDKVYPISPVKLDPEGNLVLAKVKVTEEKGTDVALASQMVFDAAMKSADLYVLISSDSDFEPTLRLLNDQLGSKIALFSPSRIPSRSLLISEKMLVKTIRESVLKVSQFPNPVRVNGHQIYMPDEWLKTEPPNV
jgi:uncharacterized LabA/DUF88 family protein